MTSLENLAPELCLLIMQHLCVQDVVYLAQVRRNVLRSKLPPNPVQPFSRPGRGYGVSSRALGHL